MAEYKPFKVFGICCRISIAVHIYSWFTIYNFKGMVRIIEQFQIHTPNILENLNGFLWYFINGGFYQIDYAVGALLPKLKGSQLRFFKRFCGIRRTYTLIGFVFYTLLSYGVLGQNYGLGDSLIRSKIVNLALANTGVCEVPVNRGKVIDKYRSVALDRKISGFTDPWCAYFIGYIYKSYGINTKKVLGKGYIAKAADWFKDKNRIVFHRGIGYRKRERPKAGDVVGYKFTSGRISHVGILIEWNEIGGYALIVEGNTTQKNSVTRDENKNDCVRLKKRPISMIYIVSNIINE